MRFSERLIAQADLWQHATDHPFIREMVDGTLDTEAFKYYLIQYYAFIKSFVDFLTYTILHADTMAQKHHLSGFLSAITSTENDYFERSFEALGVLPRDYHDPWRRSPAIQGFQQALKSATHGDVKFLYSSCLIALTCAETVYLTWAMKYQDKTPDAFYFNEWITRHNNPEFQAFVGWLHSEVDKLADFPEEEQERFCDKFNLIVQLEAQFFDECYAIAKRKGR